MKVFQLRPFYIFFFTSVVADSQFLHLDMTMNVSHTSSYVDLLDCFLTFIIVNITAIEQFLLCSQAIRPSDGKSSPGGEDPALPVMVREAQIKERWDP